MSFKIRPGVRLPEAKVHEIHHTHKPSTRVIHFGKDPMSGLMLPKDPPKKAIMVVGEVAKKALEGRK